MRVVQGWGFHELRDIPFSDSQARFRRATKVDLALVWRMVYNAYSQYIPILGRTPPTFLEDFDGHVARGDLWMLETPDGTNAMCVLTEREDALVIQALCVDPSYQGQGLGRAMLAFAEREARARGCGELRLYTNSKMERNLRIYRQWGFKVTLRETYAWGKRVHLRKLLSIDKVVTITRRRRQRGCCAGARLLHAADGP